MYGRKMMIEVMYGSKMGKEIISGFPFPPYIAHI